MGNHDGVKNPGRKEIIPQTINPCPHKTEEIRKIIRKQEEEEKKKNDRKSG